MLLPFDAEKTIPSHIFASQQLPDFSYLTYARYEKSEYEKSEYEKSEYENSVTRLRIDDDGHRF